MSLAELETLPPCEPHGYIIQSHDNGPDRWRTMDSLGMPDWTSDKLKALCFSRKEHADTYALDDDTPVKVVQTSLLEVYQDALHKMTDRKDGAYFERNQTVAALAKCFPSGTLKTAIDGWSEDWHGCVYIDLPTGQVSWHYHDSQAHLFADLPTYPGKWDGHDTSEKYRRVNALKPVDFYSREVWANAATRGKLFASMMPITKALEDEAYASQYTSVDDYRLAMLDVAKGYDKTPIVEDVETPLAMEGGAS